MLSLRKFSGGMNKLYSVGTGSLVVVIRYKAENVALAGYKGA